MAKGKKGKTDRGTVKSLDIVKNKCKVCGIEYDANKTIWSNGDTIISPPRCPKCQTAHLTNLRVNKTIKDLSLLGNLKARLSDKQREAVLNAVGNSFQGLMDRYAGTTIQSSAFDIAKI